MEELIRELKQDLVSIIIYEQKHLIVTKKLDFKTLSIISEIVKKKKYIPLILTEEEIKGSQDIFPLEFLDIKLNYELIYGKDIFKDIKLNKKHIRRQLEFEFRSKLIKLRESYIELSDSKKELKELIIEAIPALKPILSGLLFLKHVEKCEDNFAMIEKQYKVRMDLFLKIIKLKDNEISMSYEEMQNTIGKLIELLQKLSEKMDKLKI